MMLPSREEETGAARVTFPRAVREQVWLHTCGRCFSHACPVEWCSNEITVFDFHMGHVISLAEGGTNSLDNLMPLCSRCNLGMGRHSLYEWSAIVPSASRCCCLLRLWRSCRWRLTWCLVRNRLFP